MLKKGTTFFESMGTYPYPGVFLIHVVDVGSYVPHYTYLNEHVHVYGYKINVHYGRGH